jgi:hypothetical protein
MVRGRLLRQTGRPEVGVRKDAPRIRQDVAQALVLRILRNDRVLPVAERDFLRDEMTEKVGLGEQLDVGERPARL